MNVFYLLFFFSLSSLCNFIRIVVGVAVSQFTVASCCHKIHNLSYLYFEVRFRTPHYHRTNGKLFFSSAYTFDVLHRCCFYFQLLLLRFMFLLLLFSNGKVKLITYLLHTYTIITLRKFDL